MRLRRTILLCAIALACVLGSTTTHAAGTLTVTTASVGGGVTRYTLAWTSTAGGAVSANRFDVRPGELLQVKFVPGAGGVQPTDLYDLTLVDEDSVDWLAGGGANLSNATATIKAPGVGDAVSTRRLYHDGVQRLDLVVANAGNAKSGTVIVWVR